MVGIGGAADDFVELETAPSRPFAEMWAEALRRSGIAVGLRPNDPPQLTALGGPSILGGVTLFVRRTDLETAREILDSMTGRPSE